MGPVPRDVLEETLEVINKYRHVGHTCNVQQHRGSAVAMLGARLYLLVASVLELRAFRAFTQHNVQHSDELSVVGIHTTVYTPPCGFWIALFSVP